MFSSYLLSVDTVVERGVYVIVPISTSRIYWFSHHTFLPRAHRSNPNKSIRRLSIIINLLKFVVLSSLRCLVLVRFRIIVTISSHYNSCMHGRTTTTTLGSSIWDFRDLDRDYLGTIPYQSLIGSSSPYHFPSLSLSKIDSFASICGGLFELKKQTLFT